jgi:hypothetical protein
MKKLSLLLFITGAIACLSFSSSALPETFAKLLDRNKMTFAAPKDYTEVPVVENEQMDYEYAIKHKTANFEIRYAIRPLDTELENYRQWEKTKKQGDIMIHPDKLYEGLMDVTVLNISNGNIPAKETFPPDAVKKEFNADWGATTITTIGKEFGQDYKYCLMVALNKKGVGNAYIFFMSDDGQVISEHFDEAFHCLTFKK